MKLINTKAYLLLVDEEAEIKHDDYYLSDDGVIYVLTTVTNGKNPLKIIAYFPLKMGAELDLPLLPNPYERRSVDIGLVKRAYEAGNRAARNLMDKESLNRSFQKYMEDTKLIPTVFIPEENYQWDRTCQDCCTGFDFEDMSDSEDCPHCKSIRHAGVIYEKYNIVDGIMKGVYL